MNFKEYIKEQERLDEVQITLGGRKETQFGQVVLLAGGAGSGKGYIADNLLQIQGKTFDVDQIKSKIISPKTIKLNQKIKDIYGIDVTKLNLKVPEDVALLHKINDEMGISKKDQQQFLDLNRNKDRLPNIIFDTTMKSIKKIDDIVKSVTAAGYKKENIHIVWVINELDTAIEQNLSRERIVPHDILVQTHELVSATMAQLLKGQIDFTRFIDGTVWLVYNKKFVDSTMAFAKDLDPAFDNSDRKGSWVQDALLFKLKEKGKPAMDFKQIPSMYIDRIKKYVPKSTIKSWGG